MRNPWTSKNPFMSAWLSSANKIAGSARGQAMAAAKREVATLQSEAAKQMIVPVIHGFKVIHVDHHHCHRTRKSFAAFNFKFKFFIE